MSDDVTQEQRITTGQEAQRMLDSMPFRGAVLAAENQIIQEWKRGKTVEDRELAFAKLNAMADVLKELRVMVGDGITANNEKRVKEKRALNPEARRVGS